MGEAARLDGADGTAELDLDFDFDFDLERTKSRNWIDADGAAELDKINKSFDGDDNVKLKARRKTADSWGTTLTQ